MTRRPRIDVQSLEGGWPAPWGSVAELADALPTGSWTLVGGLMTQLHCVHYGIDAVRPTNDIDIVLHVETARGVPSAVADSLETLGYRFAPSIDSRKGTAHRFVRDQTAIDVVASSPVQVDILVADHAAPRVVEKMRGYEMVKIEGGTQALRRTVNAMIEVGGRSASISVPGPFGALILKAAAYQSDTRNPERHLFDAAALLACVEDPVSEIQNFSGSDRSRVQSLVRALPVRHRIWRSLPLGARTDAQRTLLILADGYRAPLVTAPRVGRIARRGKTTPGSTAGSFAPVVRDEPNAGLE